MVYEQATAALAVCTFDRLHIKLRDQVGELLVVVLNYEQTSALT